MKLVFRTADPTDVAALVALYDRHDRGGYSASFDRYARFIHTLGARTERTYLYLERPL